MNLIQRYDKSVVEMKLFDLSKTNIFKLLGMTSGTKLSQRILTDPRVKWGFHVS